MEAAKKITAMPMKTTSSMTNSLRDAYDQRKQYISRADMALIGVKGPFRLMTVCVKNS
jgi:hypothetical protein